MKTFFKNIGNTIVKKLRKHPLICNLVLSVVLAFVLEVLGRQTFDLSAVGFVDQRSKMFLYSIFIIFVTYSVTLITKRRLFSYIIVTLLWSIVGIVNFMMLSSRNTPFTYVDITLMKSVLPVMNNYFSPLEIGAMGALLLIALVLLVVAYMYLPIEEHLNRKSGFIKVIVIIAVFSGVTSYGFKSGMLVDQIHNIRIAFSDYGTPYCFSITALKNGIDKPSDYSEKKMEKLTKYLEDFDGTVTIKVEGNEQIAETRVSYQGITYKAVTAHKDLYASIDKNIDILEGQIRKTKTKRERLNKEATIRASQEEQTEPENEIIKELYYEIKPMTPEDAKLKLQENKGNTFLTFVNLENGKVNVIYKLKDNKNYGLIEPEA